MRIPLEIDGTAGQLLEVESAGWFRSPRLWVDGELARKGPKRNQFLYTNKDGIQKMIMLKQVFVDPVPQVHFEGEVMHLVEPLTTLQWIWSALPIVLVFLGGALGGAIGGAAFWINTRVFRSEMSSLEQFILTGLVSAISVVVYLILGTLFYRLIY